jgi:AcrR family transcriptional regulator
MDALNAYSEGPIVDTRSRLLEAATDVFAEQGFRNATVHEICRRAKANIAAVNYHFGDKLSLYTEVLRESHRGDVEKFGPEPDLDNGPPEERLSRFVRSFLQRILNPDRPARHGRLIAREMIEPTGVLAALVRDDVRPRNRRLEAIVREILGRRADDDEIRLTALSIVGQCLFFYHSRPMLELLHPAHRYDHTQIDCLTEHITRFSLAALRGLAMPPRRGKR